MVVTHVPRTDNIRRTLKTSEILRVSRSSETIAHGNTMRKLEASAKPLLSKLLINLPKARFSFEVQNLKTDSV